jgi:rubrerythrin
LTRAFTSLNPQEALHVAIFIEERNAGIYHRFAEMFTEFHDAESLEIASVFWDMAVEEKRHSGILQESYQQRYGNAGCWLTEEDLRDMIEVPRLEDGDVFAAGATKDHQARERALKVALVAETSAHDFYARLVEQTEDGALRRLYTELSMMEDGHVVYLQRMLATSAPAARRKCSEQLAISKELKPGLSGSCSIQKIEA